ncbi:hypothetical protein ACWET9_17060 [Streptomyces sp. NPDC004059]
MNSGRRAKSPLPLSSYLPPPPHRPLPGAGAALSYDPAVPPVVPERPRWQWRPALDRFYGAVHHQGSVYPPTAASLPFLFEPATDGATPDRAAVIALLVSIGRESLDRAFEDDGTEIEYHPAMGYCASC